MTIIPLPVLFHLTGELATLTAILGEATVRALKPYGALHNHRELAESQRVACFSEIGLEDMSRVAGRHGTFGLGFHKAWMVGKGARPVQYLPRDTPLQERFFNVVKSLAYGSDPVLDHQLWKETPFIDYPRVEAEGERSDYDWRWEREWRVLGDLTIDEPADVAFLIGPEQDHGDLLDVWQFNAGGRYYGSTPPIIDTKWSLERKVEAIASGPTALVDEFDEFVRLQNEDEAMGLDASTGQSQSDCGDALSKEQSEEWAHWLDDMERVD